MALYIQNTLKPYKVLPHSGIQYSVCRDYENICRYRNLRQSVQSPGIVEDRMITLETVNPFTCVDVDFIYHDVMPREENRLDLIADKYMGSAEYGWAIAYYNDIVDGYTVHPGQRIRIPKDITSLMRTGEILQSVTALQLNLGSE